MAKGKLGFGWMRLPQKSENPEDIDFEQVNQMVDAYLDAGFDYFDTSYVYHNGKSENAIQRCLISRYPREKFRLASKLPTFAITKTTKNTIHDAGTESAAQPITPIIMKNTNNGFL